MGMKTFKNYWHNTEEKNEIDRMSLPHFKSVIKTYGISKK